MNNSTIAAIVNAVGWLCLKHAFDQDFLFYLGGSFVTLALIVPLCQIVDALELRRRV